MMFGSKTRIIPYTIRDCQSCGHTKMPFRSGDCVLDEGRCDTCGDTTIVRGILGEEEHT